MIGKISKHLTFLYRRFNQRNEIRKIKEYQNPTLDLIVDSFIKVKSECFEKIDTVAFQRQSEYARRLQKDDSIVSYEIFKKGDFKKVSSIYQKAASPYVWCQFYYFLIKLSQTKNFLEIGTNLGVSGGYILEALKHKHNSKLITLEGVSDLKRIAQKHFDSITPPENFEIILGLYEQTFQSVLDKELNYQLIFIDGNHQKNATLEYFEKLLPKLSSPGIILFDDINWTTDMKEAWEFIKAHESVNYSIDFYKLGLIVVDKNDQNKNIDFALHLSN